MIKNEWVKKNDTPQWIKLLPCDRDNLFSVIEIRELDSDGRFGLCMKSCLDVEDYGKAELTSILSGYYEGVNLEHIENNIQTLYGGNVDPDDINAISAECIFESMSDTEMDCVLAFESEEDAEDFGIRFTKSDCIVISEDLGESFDAIVSSYPSLDNQDIFCLLQNSFDVHGIYEDEEDVGQEWIDHVDSCPEHLIPYIDLEEYGRDLIRGNSDAWLKLPSGRYAHGYFTDN